MSSLLTFRRGTPGHGSQLPSQHGWDTPSERSSGLQPYHPDRAQSHQKGAQVPQEFFSLWSTVVSPLETSQVAFVLGADRGSSMKEHWEILWLYQRTDAISPGGEILTSILSFEKGDALAPHCTVNLKPLTRCWTRGHVVLAGYCFFTERHLYVSFRHSH